ncbi:hypothetical protein AGR1A_Cc50228 [Agrobacterium fabacearum CFBP 5771]|nr:hypothetical protein AGR1A_Cc50228 [Agrobacterium fabacearum CFBP 5771]
MRAMQPEIILCRSGPASIVNFLRPVDTSKKRNCQSRLCISPEVMGEKISTVQKVKMLPEGWQQDSAIIH